ncbi:hypothetical protein FNH22_12605 [Fulvivirga sp. M361]|uniref:hypothetical protein n=1 Tax=Fulvivirga sp. M361 TaxID=2594266 RepID=UPI00117BCADF|nr:hypothetical protein [Fulvivirga sp. M361]TRX58712.1 hypothetical protein FNH22_12605 [Fulvivirga sp. M361]
MNTIIKKQAIVQSLDSMNDGDMENVLGYIKELLYNEQLDMTYQDFKKQAMIQINQALDDNKKLVTA